MKRFYFLNVFNSPFKRPQLKWYIGKVAIGTPYFLPRKWVKISKEEAHDSTIEQIQKLRAYRNKHHDSVFKIPTYNELYKQKLNSRVSVPKKIGFDFVSLGWKTKYDSYRHEWNPLISFVFFKWQIAVILSPKHSTHYWECWLYYHFETDKTKTQEERIKACIAENPCIWTSYKGTEETTTDYYKLILKDKFQHLVNE